jgi:hypothetical protein
MPIDAIDPLRPLSLPSSRTLARKTSRAPIIEDKIYPAPSAPQTPHIPITKPKLAAPVLPQYKLLGTLSKLSDHSHERLSADLDRINRSQDERRELIQEHAQRLKESAERTQEGEVWTFLRKVGATCLAGVSTFFGLTLATSGSAPVTAGLLISAGIVSISNLALSEAGVWNTVAEKLFPEDEEKRKKFLIVVPGLIALASAACSAAASGNALLLAPTELSQQIPLILTTILNLAEGVTSIGEGVSKYRSCGVETELTRLTSDLFSHQNQFEKITGGLEKVVKLLGDTHHQASKIIKLSLRTGEQVC